jgi:hypothetical protein
MKFFMPLANVCLGNAVNNPYLAVGVITESTPTAFAEFAKTNQPYAPIEFTSTGGNLLAALKLGELIRDGRYDTSLGKICASACTYAIMGGVKRYIAEQELNADSDYDNRNVGATGTQLGVHQFYSAEALSEPQKRAFSSIDKSADQVLAGILLDYTLRMGVDPKVVAIASSIPPWEKIRWLTQDEMLAWKFDNTHRQYGSLMLQPFGRLGSYVETKSFRGKEESYLRIFCKKGVDEPFLVFVVDSSVLGVHVPENSEAKSIFIEEARSLLSRMVLSLELEHEKIPSLRFATEEVKAVKSGDTMQVYNVVRALGISRDKMRSLRGVALVDAGDLARAEWTFQDFVKFQIKGDSRLVQLAMRNCVD